MDRFFKREKNSKQKVGYVLRTLEDSTLEASCYSYLGLIQAFKQENEINSIEFVNSRDAVKFDISKNQKVEKEIRSKLLSCRTLNTISFGKASAHISFITPILNVLTKIQPLDKLKFNEVVMSQALTDILFKYLCDIQAKEIQFNSIQMVGGSNMFRTFGQTLGNLSTEHFASTNSGYVTDYPIFSHMVIKTSTLVTIEFTQVSLSDRIMGGFSRALKLNKTVRKFVFYKTTGLSDLAVCFLCFALIKRKKIVALTPSLEAFKNFGAFMIAKAVEDNSLSFLNIRRPEFETMGLKMLSTSFVRQEQLEYLSLRLVYLIKEADSSWQNFVMAVGDLKLQGMKTLRVSNIVPDEVNEALAKRKADMMIIRSD